jgi:hypothetical protein
MGRWKSLLEINQDRRNIIGIADVSIMYKYLDFNLSNIKENNTKMTNMSLQCITKL